MQIGWEPDLNEVTGRGTRAEKIPAPIIHIDKVAFVYGKGLAGFGPVIVDKAAWIFIRSAQKGTAEDQLTATPASDTFSSAHLLLLPDVLGANSAKEEPSELVP